MNITSQYTNFIGMYQDVFPDGFCNHLINEFERLLVSGACSNRQDSENTPKTTKEDYHYFLNFKFNSITRFNEKESVGIFLEGLQKCFDEYVNEYDILKERTLRSTVIKMQKTDPGAGYHVWHFEQGTDHDAARCLVFIAYLNDIEDAGETEFLYQRLRIPPKENSMVIWPAGFTHTHRGNVVHGNKSKYIVTGWFYLE
jgi:hypothetical protein